MADHLTEASEAKINSVSKSMRQRQLQWYEHEQWRGSEEDVKHVTETKTTGKKKQLERSKRGNAQMQVT